MFLDINFSKMFTSICRRRKEAAPSSEIFKILTEEYCDLSRRVERSKIQDAASIRGTLRARRVAEILIKPDGLLDLALLVDAIEILKKHLHFVGPNRLADSLMQAHLLKALTHLSKCSATQKLVHQFSRPESHSGAEQVIRETLDLPHNTVVTDRHIRQAALAAWFSYLRQSVGSCFATAPALVLQAEQPEQFLMDLKELLETGRLKRVAGGLEIHAPLSTSWGVGDLRKPLILENHKESDYREVGLSPGILAALTEAGVIEKTKPLKEKVEQVQKLVTTALPHFETNGLYFAVTAEQIIKDILLSFYRLTEEHYEEWLKRPRSMIQSSLMLHMPHSDVGQRGRGEAGAKMMQAFETAKAAFKCLSENAFLKTWEFTLASFAETKSEFSSWNLYTSLGFDAQEKNGIGYCFYEIVKERLDRSNQKVQEYQEEYEVLYSQLIHAEGRARAAQSEKEMAWLKAEYQSKYNEYQTFEQMRNRENARAYRLSKLFSDLIQRYISLFPRYFQEVYDAEVHEVSTVLWDDRPAGFRLLFKHGRMNTAAWSRIDSPESFSEALASFFSLTESEISYAEEFEGLEQDVSDMVTRAIHHVKTKDFLESALWRMAKIHHEPLYKNPLEHLDQISKKPWAYTSGGSLVSLVASYFNLRAPPQESSRFIESEIELVQFAVDTMKQLPPSITEDYLQNVHKRLLMQSPTHAFSLLPGQETFKEAWETEEFTYTWIRDTFVHPAQMYWEGYVVSEARYEKIIAGLLKMIPSNFQPRFKQVFNIFPGEMSPSDLATYIIEKAQTDSGMQFNGKSVIDKKKIDPYFFDNLPFLVPAEIISRGEAIFSGHEKFGPLWPRFLDTLQDEPVSTHELLDRLGALYIEKTEATSFEEDIMKELVDLARVAGWLPPQAIIFADTNWPHFFFTMLVSPASGLLELWRTDRLALTGAPMLEWTMWVNGSKPDSRWGLLTRPSEYKK